MRLRRASRALLWSVAAVALGACGTLARPGFDAATESTKLLQRDAEWADAATAGKDVDKSVSYWTDDAVVMEPGQPALEGKAAIRAFVSQNVSAPGFETPWVSEKPTFSWLDGLYTRGQPHDGAGKAEGGTDDDAHCMAIRSG